MFQQMITPEAGFTLTEQFITMLMSVLAMLGTISVLMAVLKLVGEERKGRTEHILARVVSRFRLLFSGLWIALLARFFMLSFFGIGLWSAGFIVVEGGVWF